MSASSQEPPLAPRWAQNLYLGMASVILLGIVSEGLLIGPSLFATTHWGRVAHADLGALLLLFMLLLPVAGRFARLPSRIILLSTVLLVLALVQVTSAALGRRSPLLAALHPALALLMAGLTVVLLIHGRQLMRERSGEMEPS